MIAFLKGTVADIGENKVILEVNGVGFGVTVPAGDVQKFSSAKGEVTVHTYLQVREDAMQLFGFANQEELEIFRLLIGVNGIGPKAAIGILSVFSANDLKFAVLAGDAKMISKAPGIGNKTAQKLILELKDKFSLMDAFEEKLSGADADVEAAADVSGDEAVQALVALGYPGSDALRAVRAVKKMDGMSTEDILKAALKHMSF